MKMTGWTYLQIDNNLRTMYVIPCTTLQHKQCERIGYCIKPYLTEVNSKKYFKLCRKITFRMLEVSYAYGTKRFMTMNPTIKILGIAKRRNKK